MNNLFFMLLNSAVDSSSCRGIVGENIYHLIEGGFLAFEVACVFAVIIIASLKLLPALTSKDADRLKTAQRTCINLAIVLAVICILPYLIKALGLIFGFDISCLPV